VNLQNAVLEPEENARRKYREYRTALKTSKQHYISALAAVYWQLSHGKKVVDVIHAISEAGTNDKGEPKLAIARADDTKIRFARSQDRLTFVRPATRYAVFELTVPWQLRGWLRGEAPVPLVPPLHLPKGSLAQYHILWEVEAWAPVPSPDPLLLKRLDGALFVIVAAWDLTPAEQAVMRQALRVR
jgi:hypothetical protein